MLEHPASGADPSSTAKNTDIITSSAANGVPCDSSREPADKSSTQIISDQDREPIKYDSQVSNEQSDTSQKTGGQTIDSKPTTAQTNGQSSDSAASPVAVPSLSIERFVDASFEEDSFGKLGLLLEKVYWN